MHREIGQQSTVSVKPATFATCKGSLVHMSSSSVFNSNISGLLQVLPSLLRVETGFVKVV